MKLLLRNTATGLKPEYNSDYEEKKKLRQGEAYWATIKKARNPKFHKKFFAMINCGWHNMNETEQREFANITAFRYKLMVLAGHFDVIYNAKDKAIVRPHSISFDKMDDAEFEEVFNDVLNVVLDQYVPTDRKQFLNAMMEFM